ncbi:uncharacterized protein LOC115625429 [Scaptodrosophila lebanonensis]|uniref:Uncharacterized protein LOC115625429 n=1 Tax=Drosophila lebanonensis TaxID=7225 RepID=A0A6J2TJZ3_DROLE|nr:uncharacterized protein LOC115625429 [Scaptodrosophila lebanonensis]
MVGLYKLLLLLLLLLPAHWIAESKLNFIPNKIECENYMPTFLTNLACVLKSNDLNETVIDMDFIAVRELNNTSVSFSFNVMIGKSTVNYINKRFDICTRTGQDALEDHIITRVISEEIKKSGNILNDCPYKKNKHYYVHGFKVKEHSIPPYFPEMNLTITIDLVTNRRKTMRFLAFGRSVKVGKITSRIIP